MGRNTVGASEILGILGQDSGFRNFIKEIGITDEYRAIKDGLLNEKMAWLIPTPIGEDFFCRTGKSDFKERGLRLIDRLEKLNG